MHSVNKSTAIIFCCLILALVFVTPTLIKGDEWNLTTRFTLNHPFEVPGMVLQPNTRYVIRLHDSPATRSVVQIFNDDQSKLLTTFMGVSDERMEPVDNTVFTFIETAPGYPVPIKEWFYPGRLHGLEFVYPKDQAMEIARHAKEPILSADAGDLHRLSSFEVEAREPLLPEATTQTASVIKSEEIPIVEEKPSVAEPAPIEPAVEEQAAQNEPEVQLEKPAETPAVTEEPQPAEELPHTAGELPLIALIGALCLGAGLGLKVLSAKS